MQRIILGVTGLGFALRARERCPLKLDKASLGEGKKLTRYSLTPPISR